MSVFDPVFSLWRRSKTLRLYVAIGGAALAVELAVFNPLAYFLNGEVVLSNAVAMTMGMITSFTLNAQYNFHVMNRMILRFVSFAMVTGISYLLSTAVLYHLVSELGVTPWLAKVISLPMVLAVQFTLNKRFTFSGGGRNVSHRGS